MCLVLSSSSHRHSYFAYISWVFATDKCRARHDSLGIALYTLASLEAKYSRRPDRPASVYQQWRPKRVHPLVHRRLAVEQMLKYSISIAERRAGKKGTFAIYILANKQPDSSSKDNIS